MENTEHVEQKGWCQPCSPFGFFPRILDVRERMLSQKGDPWHPHFCCFERHCSHTQGPQEARAPSIFRDFYATTWVPLEVSGTRHCIQACFFGMAPEGANCPADFCVQCLALTESSRPVQWARRFFSYLGYVNTQDDLNSAAVFPLVFQTPKLKGIGDKSAKNQIHLKLSWPTGITTNNTEHSLPDIAALTGTNKKIQKVLEVFKARKCSSIFFIFTWLMILQNRLIHGLVNTNQIITLWTSMS